MFLYAFSPIFRCFKTNILLNSILLYSQTKMKNEREINNNMRRRNMLGNTAKLTLSSNSYSASPGASTQYVYAYYGGNAITDLTSSMISNSNTSLMSFSVNSSGYITVSINSQNGNKSSRSGSLTLTYQGQQQVFSVTQDADYIVSQNTTYSTTGYEPQSVSNTRTTITSDTKCVNTNSITVNAVATSYTYNNITYASGYVSKVTTNTTTLTKTQTIPAGGMEMDYTVEIPSFASSNMYRITRFNYSGDQIYIYDSSNYYLRYYDRYGDYCDRGAQLSWNSTINSYYCSLKTVDGCAI